LDYAQDTAERYLSTPLFAGIGADMDEEELKISLSTAGQHMPAPEDA
jgi:cysteine synthase A